MNRNRPNLNKDATLSELGEFGLIGEVTAALPSHGDVLIGPGDDAAAVRFAGPVLISADVLVEGVHFRRDWSSAHQIGRKAAAVNISDIEAMGGRAKALVVCFSAPGDLPASWAVDCLAGLAEEAALCGAVVVGGDTTASRDVTIAVTVFGSASGEPVRRAGARAGQVVALAGRVGWAAGGLTVLQRGFSAPRDLVAAHQVPTPPYGEGEAAARAGASALIDVSDGLLADLRHIADASGVCIDVHTSAFEAPESLQRLAAATGASPMRLMLTGGEDHALAGCFDATRVPEGWRVIGEVRQGSGVLVDGQDWEGSEGWDHFTS
ncbi:MAG: thiamine-phosphate kinase [Propionibacteriaceae bacterium]|nr:thiamine-phosphate kinase [Propionibacteriaceae bacterium]